MYTFVSTKMAQKFSLDDVHGTVDPARSRTWVQRVLLFFGPAFLVSVGYMDPGNWATDIAGGSRYGYALLWVLLMSNLIAVLLQTLSAKLGIVRGMDLAQVTRERYPGPVNAALWVLAEIAIAACDLAEVVGMAIGLNLLTGLPLIWGVLLTLADTLIIVALQSFGIRKLEAFILALVLVVSASFLIELWFAKPVMGQLVYGFIPSLPDKGALLIATGIIGATVMPHNLYLHSALVQTRAIGKTDSSKKRALQFNRADSVIALNLAFFVNAAILCVAAAVFYAKGYNDVADIQDAHQLLAPLVGSALAPILFAVALIAAGQSSTVTGTLAGQIVMEGFIDLRITPWLRRLITRLLAVGPAALVILWLGDKAVGDMLIISQVVLSLQLGFAVVPLIFAVSDRPKMGAFTITPFIKILAWLSTAIIVILNFNLVVQQLQDWGASGVLGNAIYLAYVLAIATIGLFGYIVIEPLVMKNRQKKASVHRPPSLFALPEVTSKNYKRIGIAVDFSSSDVQGVQQAMLQGGPETEYVLIHIVESAGARMLGNDISDREAQTDAERLEDYALQLRALGFDASAQIGFGTPSKGIVRIVQSQELDLLVMASHGHTGLWDYLFGETVDAVRHKIKVPLLVVNKS